MIAISERPVRRSQWSTISFPSTLYLCPVLDLLLAKVPDQWQLEIRLGLQEALVNAAKHGNKLDPSKKVSVRFSVVENHYWWVISDQGCGHLTECCFDPETVNLLPEHDSECGRGLFIIHQIFDRVQWDNEGRELKLCKELTDS